MKASLFDKVGEPTDSPTRRTAVDEALALLERNLDQAALISDENERDSLLVAACLRWAEFDPADALDLVRQLGLDQVAHAGSEAIIQKWAATNFRAALAWTSRKPAGEQRDHLMARLAFVRAQSRPAEAARLVEVQIPPGPAQAEANISVLHQWALRDFGGALTRVDRLPADLQERARAELIGIANGRLAISETVY